MCLKEQADSGKATPNADVYATQELDRLIVPEKATNDAKAEAWLKGRGWTKENMIHPVVTSTQNEYLAILKWIM